MNQKRKNLIVDFNNNSFFHGTFNASIISGLKDPKDILLLENIGYRYRDCDRLDESMLIRNYLLMQPHIQKESDKTPLFLRSLSSVYKLYLFGMY
jgi:hypothetical protein